MGIIHTSNHYPQVIEMRYADHNVRQCEIAYSAAIDFNDAVDNEKYELLNTPEFDADLPENMIEALSVVLADEAKAAPMNLMSERADFLDAVKTADFQAMGDLIRLISRAYWDFLAEEQAIENVVNQDQDDDYPDDY